MGIRLYRLPKRKISLIEAIFYRSQEIEKIVNAKEGKDLSTEKLYALKVEIKHLAGFLHYYYVFHIKYVKPK